MFLLAYVVGFSFDAVDGLAARHFNQCTRFGAILDMVTDRCSTVGLLGLLCSMSPSYSGVWIVLMMLDLSAHWLQVYASLATGRTSHKDASASMPLVKLYYTNRAFMAACCISAEVSFLCIFSMCHTTPLHLAGGAPQWATAASAWLTGSCTARTPDAVLASIALLSVPGCLMKQVVNAYQLAASADMIVELDSKRP
eukprot:jgi/Ulvmu1/5098/UM021_0115.1